MLILPWVVGCGSLDRLSGVAGDPRPRLQESILGRWQNTLVLQTQTGDVQTNETTWTFEVSLDCSRLVVIRSTALFFPDSTLTSCSYEARSTEVDVLFEGSTEVVTFDARVLADTLLLDQFRFLRIP